MQKQEKSAVDSGLLTVDFFQSSSQPRRSKINRADNQQLKKSITSKHLVG